MMDLNDKICCFINLNIFNLEKEPEQNIVCFQQLTNTSVHIFTQ